jgi:hypothetical protein
MVTRCCIVVSVARVELAGSRSAGRRSSTAAGSIEAQCVRACVQCAVCSDNRKRSDVEMRRNETRQTNDRGAGVLARPSCVVWWESAGE